MFFLTKSNSIHSNAKTYRSSAIQMIMNWDIPHP